MFRLSFLVTLLVASASAKFAFGVDKEVCHYCGHNCDDDCNCGVCAGPSKCATEELCLGVCNSGGNAKWCGASKPTPVPAPTPPPAPTDDGVCHYCGHNCDDNCNCGVCSGPSKCANEGLCMGVCNSGGNAKWCGPTDPPTLPPTNPPAPPKVAWSTAANKIQANGKDVVLKGFGTTCTEYLMRGVGEKCFISYSWTTPANIFEINTAQIDPLIALVKSASNQTGTMPAVRIPLTASSWLGVNTSSSAENMGKYPDLPKQYRDFIASLVATYTGAGIVTILDLHWSNDDTDNGPMMATKSGVNCITFWDHVASQFADNDMVVYELYNEPHVHDVDLWMNGDADTAGMLDMLAAVRAHSSGLVIIAGAKQYAYDSASLLTLDAKLVDQGARNVIFNFHPYMGPPQSGASAKCPAGFESMVKAITTGSERPVIITEFGQNCCATNGACESCPASTHGYDEDIIIIAEKYGVSWLPWSWNPMASGPDVHKCEYLNGAPGGLSLAHPTDGKGADFLTLWKNYA